MPAASSHKLHYTATAPTYYTLMVCNGEGADAHVSMWIVEGADPAWIDGAAPAAYQVIIKKQLVESDGPTGNIWTTPSFILNPGDRLVVFTDLVGVTFNGHGIPQL